MRRKYRGMRKHGCDMFTAAMIAFLSEMVGQPDHKVTVLNIDFEV